MADMKNLEKIIQSIQPRSEEAYRGSVARWNALAKPLGSLGVLEEDISRIAAVRGTSEFELKSRTLLILCADNGVIAQGVSQSDASVTEAVASALGEGTSTVNYMADAAGCRVLPVDIGMASAATPKNVLNKRIQNGTGDITQGAAMTEADCEAAILAGVELVQKEKENGADILLVGEMGIGNTTTSAAVACVLLDKSPELLTGRGAGLSDLGLNRKIEAVRSAIRINGPDPKDPFDIVRKIGGFDLAALCGVCLGAALERIPVILDGVITNTAALLAVRMCPPAVDALIASHVSREPAAVLLLEELGLNPVISADLHLGEGSGAVLALSLLDQAMAVYNSGHTFGHLGIEAYTPQ